MKPYFHWQEAKLHCREIFSKSTSSSIFKILYLGVSLTVTRETLFQFLRKCTYFQVLYLFFIQHKIVTWWLHNNTTIMIVCLISFLRRLILWCLQLQNLWRSWHSPRCRRGSFCHGNKWALKFRLCFEQTWAEHCHINIFWVLIHPIKLILLKTASSKHFGACLR